MLEQLHYIKRYQMERSLTGVIPEAVLPGGFSWQSWDDRHLSAHAEVQYLCFHDSLDVEVFPSFATRNGCQNVLQCIRHKDGFCPSASWLLLHEDQPVGTVQGLSDRPRTGAIQNLGVVPAYRRQGLGVALLRQAMRGFQHIGLTQIYLEVTAKNSAALQLYRANGFRCSRTIYKPILVTQPGYAGSGI